MMVSHSFDDHSQVEPGALAQLVAQVDLEAGELAAVVDEVPRRVGAFGADADRLGVGRRRSAPASGRCGEYESLHLWLSCWSSTLLRSYCLGRLSAPIARTPGDSTLTRILTVAVKFSRDRPPRGTA